MAKDEDKSDALPERDALREEVWRVIFQHDTKWAKRFDVILLWLIGASVLVIMLESVEGLAAKYVTLFHVLEWMFTAVFTVEYALRIWVVRRKRRYVLSFFGVVDFLSILPTYLGLFFAGSQYMMMIRILRLLRMFRVLKMARHVGEANILLDALRASRTKILVFVFGVLTLVCIEGTLMYLIEGRSEDSGFTSIPTSIYWGIVTITTVGYGDIAPVTVLGKMMASVIMLTGFAIIAVPTGIVTAEIGRQMKIVMDSRKCNNCGLVGHDPAAEYCKMCGKELEKQL
jgi:voltage-gated potassium channel